MGVSGSSRFPWQIFTRVVLIQSILVLLAIGLSGLTARYYFKRRFVGQAESMMSDTLKVLSVDLKAVDSKRGAPKWCAEHAGDSSFRLTLVQSDGSVLCDSQHDHRTMENHSSRPEIVSAVRDGVGHSERFSSTLGEAMIYVARSVPERSVVLRAGIPIRQLSELLHWLDTALVIFLLVVAMALGLFAVWSGRLLVFPIGRLLVMTQNVLQGTQPSDHVTALDALKEESFGEWSELESSIDTIRRDLAAKAEILSIEREELATLMSAISDAILAVDTEGRPLFYNTRFALLFGNQEALREHRIRLWEMFRVPEILEAFKEALDHSKTAEVKAVSLEREGENKRFFAVSVSPLHKKGGAVYGAVGIFHDVTDLKGAEQIRIDFVANVSHELRTPLTSIKGYTDTLLMDVQDGRPVSREFLDIIARNVDRLMNLIRDLLDLSSLESTDVLHKTAINTPEVTTRVIRQLKGAFDSKRQTVIEEYAAPVVLADARRVEQVLVNLLENANKYTPNDGEIRVSWETERNSVILRVSDNGPGIPPEHHARLFERFYRVDKARSRDQGGTGLGLSIVKHIMQRHDGTVWVESRAGKGSSFVCRFPV